MNIRISTAVLLLSTACSAQYLDSRNRAMGGTGVASSHYTSAGFINPALLTHFGDTDDFGFIFPSVSITAADKDGLLDAIDVFQDDLDSLKTKIDNKTATVAETDALIASLLALDGKQATLNFGTGLSVAMPSETFAWSFVAHSYVDAQVAPQIDPADEAVIRTAISGAAIDNLKSEGRILGAAITEVGLAFATQFSVGGTGISVGATPKVQRVETYNYSINITSFDVNDFDDSRFRDDTTQFNLDIGAAATVLDGMVTFGLVGRNLIEHESRTVVTNGTVFTRYVGPSIKAGAALRGGGATIAVDIDVMEVDRFKNNDGSQFLNVGGEYDLFGWLQVRLGFQTDLEDTVSDLITGGLGISPFDTIHLDLTGVYGDGDTYGGMLQLWFTF